MSILCYPIDQCCQTFVLYNICMQDYGHRVRLATHANFKEFVLTSGLEFFPLGGDPKVLANCKYSILFLSCSVCCSAES